MASKSLGPYEILEPLGAGGMGEVYRARDTQLDRDVAIKILPESLAGDSERLKRFEREAKLLASLNHPNIASIYNMERHVTSLFLVLELVEGESLEQRLERGSLSIEQVLRIGRQVAEAVGAAHREGIVHRDLKPANVMVSRETSDVKVLDFSIAKVMRSTPTGDGLQSAELTRTGAVLGTTPYISPEHLRGETTDHRADIWAFVCLMFEMLTGKRPFARATAAATIAAILETEPAWDSLPRQTPERIKAIVQRCLDKDPDRRIARIQDARIEIEATEGPALDGRSRSGERRRLIPWAIAGAGAVAAWGALYSTGVWGGSDALPGPTVGSVDYIAVLPFENQSGDGGQDYVAAAMTDALTTGLGSVEG